MLVLFQMKFILIYILLTLINKTIESGDHDDDDTEEVTEDFYDYKTEEPYIPPEWMRNSCFNVTCVKHDTTNIFREGDRVKSFEIFIIFEKR